MSNNNVIPEILRSLAIQLPTLLVCLAAGIVVFARWRQGSRGSVWALLGFGLAVILCFVIPVGQIVVPRWVIQSGTTARLGPTYTGLAVLWSVLRAVSYALLLVAVFAGRTPPQSVTPPPMPRV